MKTIIVAVLCGSLVLIPLDRPKAQVQPVCIIIIAMLAVTGVVVIVKSCQPKFRCLDDPDNPELGHWCQAITTREAQLEGWNITGGPYQSMEACNFGCLMTNQLSSASMSLDDVTIYIEKSTDLKTWVVCGTQVGQPDDFYWSQTNTADTACFYRARY